MGPDFLGIGMERAGTSWLFKMLAAHPDIWVPPLKELHYFDVISPELKGRSRRYNRHLLGRIRQKAAHVRQFPARPELYKNGLVDYLRWDARFFRGPQNDAWYRGLFDPRFTRGRVCGEITPAYGGLSPAMIAHVHALNPDVKIVLMVRDPADRAWSGMIFKLCRIDGRDFASIQEDEMLELLRSEYVRDQSDVSKIIGTWKEIVPPERMFLRSTAEMRADPADLLGDLYSFLGVEASFLPPASLMSSQINTYTKQSYKQPEAVRKYLEETYGANKTTASMEA